MSGVCILGGQPDYPGHKVSSTGVGNSILVGPEGPVGAKEGAQGTPGSPELAMSQDKVLERAQSSGVVNLSSRGLKLYPPAAGKYKLKDTVVADLSRNKLSELPCECTEYYSLERLVLYHNVIKSIPESVVSLQALQFLDISRNQLSYLPETICQLSSLRCLIVNNNKLVSLPEEVGRMQSLTELDASCNEITHLPVQIGDMTNLRSLNLRRNHLQEVPVEINFLRVVHLDLSCNRITSLPVELRFMTTVVDLSLGQNPLSCPPANLVSRGKVHIFKYLEIQAIKEDRKRGVLTDTEYRRSYRKTTTGQLSDIRFGNGFGADARRKRHTADSGYASEHPLDRRWSQDFSQDTVDGHPNHTQINTDEARRIIMRAATASETNGSPRSPSQRPPTASGSAASEKSGILNVIGSRMSQPAAPSGYTPSGHPPGGGAQQHPPPPPPPQHSGGSQSSGHSSMSSNPSHTPSPPTVPQHSPPLPPPPETAPDQYLHPSSSNSSTKTTNLLPPNSRVPIHYASPSQLPLAATHQTNMSPSRTPQSPPPTRTRHSNSASNLLETSYDYAKTNGSSKTGGVGGGGGGLGVVNGNMSNSEGQLLVAENTDVINNGTSNNNHVNSTNGGNSADPSTAGTSPRGSSPDTNNEAEKETHRRAAHRLLGKQGQGNKEILKRQNATAVSSASTDTVDNGLPTQSAQPTVAGYTRTSHYSVTRVTTATSSSAKNGVGMGGGYDMKAVQKEAVLSYYKAKASSSTAATPSTANATPSTNGDSSTNGDIRRSVSPRPHPHQQSTSQTRLNQAVAATSRSSNIPQPGKPIYGSTNGSAMVNNRLLSHQSAANRLAAAAASVATPHGQHVNGSLSNTHHHQNQQQHHHASVIPTSANSTADAHIAQLKNNIESRLRIPIPDNVSGALADGVILCHIANHVKPRAVATIHVPSAGVPKLPPAKCKRNIENFLLACKRLGVREDLICSPGDVFEPRKQGTVRVSITVSELLRQPRQVASMSQTLGLHHNTSSSRVGGGGGLPTPSVVNHFNHHQPPPTNQLGIQL